jgi:hypothetical protein
MGLSQIKMIVNRLRLMLRKVVSPRAKREEEESDIAESREREEEENDVAKNGERVKRRKLEGPEVMLRHVGAPVPSRVGQILRRGHCFVPTFPRGDLKCDLSCFVS